MADLSRFPITRRWPAEDPGKIQLYSRSTPNGVKASIVLEELGLPYEAHPVSFADDDQLTPEFLSLNPNNKVPAMIDPDGPGGEPLPLFESGAILIYLADKTGKLIPGDGVGRAECVQWLMFQMGNIGPMFGQFGHFHRLPEGRTADTYALDRYRNESKRILAVLEGRLAGRDFLLDSGYGIADIATFPWIRVLGGFYDAAEALDLPSYPRVMAYLERCLERPAVQRGLVQPPRD